MRGWTPWIARPKGGRTAAEESGLDLEPPPLDRLDDGVLAEVTEPPENQAPAAVVEAVEGATAEPSSTRAPPPVEVTSDEVVSWEAAHEPLDHERRSDMPDHPPREEET